VYFLKVISDYTTRFTLPDFRQLVQTFTRRGAPSTRAFTFCTFAFQVRLVFMFEWLTANPVSVPFPHTVHLLDNLDTSLPDPQYRPDKTKKYFSRAYQAALSLYEHN